MADIQYWDDTLSEEIEAIQSMLDRIPSMSTVAERSSSLERVKAKLRSAAGTKRSFKMETRLVTDTDVRRKFESRLATREQQLRTLQADAKALESEISREQLMGGGGGADGEEEFDPIKAGDNMLKEASQLQDKTATSLDNTKQLIAESKEVGVSTLEELERQRGVIESIERETDRIDDNLARAEKLLKQFGKRMASDHFIQCLGLVNCLLFIGVIFYAVFKGGGLSQNDGTPESPASSEPPPDADDLVGDHSTPGLLRLLRRG